MINSLDEAIKHYERQTEALHKVIPCDGCPIDKCKEECQQLAEWLRELKFYKDRQELIDKSWQELIKYKEGIEKIKMRSQAYRERGETILASGMEQALDILEEGLKVEKKEST